MTFGMFTIANPKDQKPMETCDNQSQKNYCNSYSFESYGSETIENQRTSSGESTKKTTGMFAVSTLMNQKLKDNLRIFWGF